MKDRRDGTADPVPCHNYSPRDSGVAHRLCRCGWGELQHDTPEQEN